MLFWAKNVIFYVFKLYLHYCYIFYEVILHYEKYMIYAHDDNQSQKVIFVIYPFDTKTPGIPQNTSPTPYMLLLYGMCTV